MTDHIVDALSAALRATEPASCPDLFDRVRGGVRRRRRRRQLAVGTAGVCVAIAAVVVPAISGAAATSPSVSAASAAPTSSPSCADTPTSVDADHQTPIRSVTHYWGQRAEPAAVCISLKASAQKPL
jgi:hypothetical protein